MSTIVLCEPTCTGFQHHGFNAALLATARLAWPEAELRFLGESEHLGWVEARLRRAVPGALHGVSFEAVPAMQLRSSYRQRGRNEAACTVAALRAARQVCAAAVLLCSLDRCGLMALHAQLRTWRAHCPVVAIPHAVLNTLEARSRPSLRRALTFNNLMHLPLPPGLTLIALGDSILEAVRATDARLARRFRALDHPWLFAPDRNAAPRELARPIRFGFVGVTSNKGFAAYLDLAERIAAARPGATEFALVGFVREDSPDLLARARRVLADVPTAPLPSEEYARRLAALSYGIWTADPTEYRLRASTVFVELLAQGVPTVYLANPYVAAYARAMGDIGHLCDSPDQMAATLLALVDQPPAKRYSRQQAAIVAGRARFAPAQLAPRLREIVAQGGSCS